MANKDFYTTTKKEKINWREEKKKVCMVSTKEDAANIRKAIGWLDRHPNAAPGEIAKHIEDCKAYMQLLDNKIQDCEHVIALGSVAKCNRKEYETAVERLTETLGLRLEYKTHMQKCHDLLDKKEEKLLGPRCYHVRTLQDEFGQLITIEHNRVVFHHNNTNMEVAVS